MGDNNNTLYQLHDKLTPEFVLRRVSQEDIYKRYLGITPELGRSFRNPLRDDKNPTCSFAQLKGKLVFRDWSETIYMDVFDVVQRRFNVGFKQAVNIIATDFGLTDGDVPAPIFTLPSAPEKKPKPQFDLRVQPMQKENLEYLKRFGITPEIASKFNVFSVKALYINGNHSYSYSKYDPALGYYFGLNSKGQQKWKVYFYSRLKNKFIGNTSRLNGWIQLPEKGPLVVLTKSLKDIMSLYRLGIPATGTQGETILPNKALIEELSLRFDHTVSLYDFDNAGIKAALSLRRNYGIPAYMLTDGSYRTEDYGAKDISDYIEMYGLGPAQELVNYAINHLYETTPNHNDPPISASL